MPTPAQRGRLNRAPQVGPRLNQGFDGKEVIELGRPSRVKSDERKEVAQAAAAKLLGTITEFKDVEGNGQESAAKGDARVTTRRRLLGTLIADKSGEFAKTDILTDLGDKVQNDIKWLMEAERKDYELEADDQFGWAQSNMSGATALESAFKTKVKEQKEYADKLAAGEHRYFDAAKGSVLGIQFLPNPEQRADALVDALLQFRAKSTGGDVGNDRADKVGPVLMAEQRILLGNSKVGSLDDRNQRRELALLRAVIASHPNNSVNGIFEARNAVAAILLDGVDPSTDTRAYGQRTSTSSTEPTRWIIHDKPPGAEVSPYKAIHHNYSTSTPKVIRSMVENWLYPVGPQESRADTFLAAAQVLQLAIKDDVAGARVVLGRLDGQVKDNLSDLIGSLDGLPDDQVAGKVEEYLKSVSQKDYGNNPTANIHQSAELFRAVCEDRPSRAGLAEELFKAGDVWPEVADVLFAIDSNDDQLLLRELGEARLHLHKAISGVDTGFERHELIMLDSELDRMVLEELGSAVERVGNHESQEQKSEAMWAMSAALSSVIASGLDAIRDDQDPTALPSRSIEEIHHDIVAHLDDGFIEEGQYRALMAEVRYAGINIVQSIRSYVDRRAADVAGAGIEIDPEFIDQFTKQSALHYATALAEGGMRVGLKESIEPDRLANIEGMRVLNSIGRVVFSSVMAAENAKELAELKPPKDVLSVLYALEEKKMVAVGGLIVDTDHAPGGNSHLNMYAMNNGIEVLALPELRDKFGPFFELAAKPESEGGGGVYVDDTKGEFVMMTVARAKADGLINAQDVEDLRPGLNRSIEYLKTNAAGDGFDVIGTHDAIISPERRTREVQLYVPLEEVKGMGKKCMSFGQIASLGVHARHLAGEKNLVLALMSQHPPLADKIPGGSVVTTGRVIDLLRKAKAPTADEPDRSLYDMWDSIWLNDPLKGRVDDDNIFESAFYTDADYRLAKSKELHTQTRASLEALLFTEGPNGEKVPTAEGEALYEELLVDSPLANEKLWIDRSSFTGEDRPGKSGAGQYESFVLLESKVDKLDGIIGVIESTWGDAPINNNCADEVDLRVIMPSVGVQKCINATKSGVAISRNLEMGQRNQVSVQVVEGFGGGVDGGKVETGVIAPSGYSMAEGYNDQTDSLLTPEQQEELRETVLEIEKYFHEVIEPGKGHAVDVEFAYEGDKLWIVQARVILMDH